ncbi:MAG: MmgE/PrpD family protein [Castellaniella sp.]
MNKELSIKIAQFVRDLSWDDIPGDVLHEVKRAMVNYFSVAIAGASDSTTNILVDYLSSVSNDNSHRVIGSDKLMSILDAAFINSMSANVFDFDDTHFPTIVHPTAPIASALLALSESMEISGRQFMLAFAIGVQVSCRIALAVSPFHYRRGWHITATCGVFGVAMAVGKILHLTQQQLVWALGHAASQASGLVECLGSMSKSISVGNAARGGLVAAQLAARSFSGPDSPLEGQFGFLNVFGDSPDIGSAMINFDRDWELRNLAYKPYPCGVVLNPVIEACLRLAVCMPREFYTRLHTIVVTGHPLLKMRTDRPNVPNGRLSQVSAQHAVAVTLIRRKAGLSEFSDEAVNDTRIRQLGKLLIFEEDLSYTLESAKVCLVFDTEIQINCTDELIITDKNKIELAIISAKGSLSNPLTDEDLVDKLHLLCTRGRPNTDDNALSDAIWNLDQMANIDRLFSFVS